MQVADCIDISHTRVRLLARWQWLCWLVGHRAYIEWVPVHPESVPHIAQRFVMHCERCGSATLYNVN